MQRRHVRQRRQRRRVDVLVPRVVAAGVRDGGHAGRVHPLLLLPTKEEFTLMTFESMKSQLSSFQRIAIFTLCLWSKDHLHIGENCATLTGFKKCKIYFICSLRSSSLA